jgi:hypothetical protein
MDNQQYQALFKASLDYLSFWQWEDDLRSHLIASGAGRAEIDEFLASRPLDSEQMAKRNIPTLKGALLQINVQSSKEDISRVQARFRCRIDRDLEGLQINVSFADARAQVPALMASSKLASMAYVGIGYRTRGIPTPSSPWNVTTN